MAQNLGNLFIDGEGTINDGSVSNHTITINGAAEINSTEKMFGNSSVRFYRNDYIYVAQNTDFDIVGSTTIDYTIDFWVRNEGTIVGRNEYMYNLVNGNYCWYMTGAPSPSFEVRIADVTVLQVITPTTIDPYIWHHIALVKEGTFFTLYIDGINKDSATFSTEVVFDAILAIGNRQDLNDWSPFVGYMDNIRLVKGTALWTEDFELTEEALFYKDDNAYIRPDNISGLYTVGSRGNLRGKASEGFIRPTLKQFFTSKNFEEVTSILERGHFMGGRAGTDNIQYTPDTWVTKEHVPFIGGRDQRYGHGGATLNNKGYVISGSNGATNVTNVDAYDLSSDSWTTKIGHPGSKYYFTCTTLLENIYTFGGFTAAPIRTCACYDGSNWTTKCSMSKDVYMATCTTILDKAYVFGGAHGLTYNYSYVEDTWIVKTSIPSPGRDSASSTTMSDKGYLFGGADTANNYLLDTDEYNSVGNSWISKTDMVAPARSDAASTTINNKCYVVQGRSLTNSYIADTDEYVLDTWVNKTDSVELNRYAIGMTIIG